MSDFSAKNLFFLGLSAFAVLTSFHLYSLSNRLKEQSERVAQMAIEKEEKRTKNQESGK